MAARLPTAVYLLSVTPLSFSITPLEDMPGDKEINQFLINTPILRCSATVVRDTLGHSSIALTSRYIHARPNDSSGLYLICRFSLDITRRYFALGSANVDSFVKTPF
jgi:hypothetical protein